MNVCISKYKYAIYTHVAATKCVYISASVFIFVSIFMCMVYIIVSDIQIELPPSTTTVIPGSIWCDSDCQNHESPLELLAENDHNKLQVWSLALFEGLLQSCYAEVPERRESTKISNGSIRWNENWKGHIPLQSDQEFGDNPVTNKSTAWSSESLPKKRKALASNCSTHWNAL